MAGKVYVWVSPAHLGYRKGHKSYQPPLMVRGGNGRFQTHRVSIIHNGVEIAAVIFDPDRSPETTTRAWVEVNTDTGAEVRIAKD